MKIKQNIIFISYIEDPLNAGTSTQIMAKNIITGLKIKAEKLTFIAIIDYKCIEKNVENFYSPLVDELLLIKSFVGAKECNNKWKTLYRNYAGLFNFKAYKALFEKNKFTNNDILVSHSPTCESIYICMELKKTYKEIKWIQYWSDPIALSGITLEQFSYKRFPFYILEKYLLAKSDDIVYGTKILMEYQKKLYKKHSNKMRYVDVSYVENEINKDVKNGEKIIFGYSGNYYSSVRNIKPLYRSFQNIEYANLVICGQGDIKIIETTNIKNINRVSQNEISDIERDFDVLVCLLNSNCIQIPGKVFYNTNSNKPILIILDGPCRKEIKEYLERFKRFEFCENNEKSIEQAIYRISTSPCNIDKSEVYKLAPEKIAEDLLYGIK